MNRHFYGDFGLEAELINAGIADADTKETADLRRIIKFDETPQMADGTATGTRKEAFGQAGIALHDKQAQNRETFSVA